MTTGKRILITGGAGFIGFHLARALAGAGSDEITVLDNFRRGKKDTAFQSLIDSKNVRFVEGDISDVDTYKRLDGAYHEVYHLAGILGVRNIAKHPELALKVNGSGVIDLLEWFVGRDKGKLLFASTSEVYAWTARFHKLPVPTPEDVPLSITDQKDSRSAYAGSKIFGELAVGHYCRQYKKPFVIVRYHNVYGPRMGREHVIPEIFLRAKGGERPLKVYSHDHSRAFCYISDAVDGTIRAMRVEKSDQEIFNIGNDKEEIPIKDLAGRILKKGRFDIPMLLEPPSGDPIFRRCPDISKAREILGYQPKIGLDEGLDATIGWYEVNG